MLLLKNVAKTRLFISPLRLLSAPIFLCSPLTSSHLFSQTCSYSTAVALQERSAESLVLSFKEWFKAQNNHVLDRIFELLNAHHCDDLASRFAADLALSRLNLRLSESFVLEVLAYTKGEDVLSCLKFFDWAGRQPGFYHTHATFLAIFKILKRAKLRSLMFDFIDNFVTSRCINKVRFYDTLIMGYAIAGKPEIALQLFGRIRFQGLDLDGFAYNVLLNALVEQNCFDVVDVIAKQIALRGFEDAFTRSIKLRSLCKQGKLVEAEEYLRGLMSSGVVFTEHAVSVVIEALCKNGKLEEAGKLLEEFRESDLVPLNHAYGIWVWSLVRAGRLDGALGFFNSMKSLEEYVPDVFRYNLLVSRLLRENRLMEVLDMLIEMKENEIVPDCSTMNLALCFFCKAGMVDVALGLYNSRSEFGLFPNGMVYNFLINTLCGDGSIDEAYNVLKNSIDQGLFPGRKTFSILASALYRAGKLEKMKELVLFALERKFEPSDSTYDMLITAFCRAGRVEDGYLIHGNLNRMNKVATKATYCSLIRGFNKCKRVDIAARLLIEMQEKGYKPIRELFRDVIYCFSDMENPEKQFWQLLEMQLSCHAANLQTYNLFIDGAGHAKMPELAKETYEMIQRSGHEPNLGANILMLQSFLKSGRVSNALDFFSDLNQKGKVGRKLYNTMIVGLCKVGRADMALELLEQMKKDGLVPSNDCYEILIKLLCSIKRYDMVIHVINDMVKVGRHVTSFLGNTLLMHALKTRDLYEAWIRLIDPQSETSEISWLGWLIGAFSGCIRVSEDIENLEEVIQLCFRPDIHTYNLLLRKLSMSDMDHACELFNKLRLKGYEPDQWTYDILIHGLNRCGRTVEAKRKLEEMYRRGFQTVHIK
ncbi:pentatricopeptide repeat-containing protein At1g71210, mitochondrial [Mangifera indica]|uniref:pentatricopeptide repeat-containing protein At1g71210, mitochondrial n=1 Tax=Mangifera indica TaxID=29780 RepID=UPI001CFAEC7E|nr:pentatricopeptide repeat-containing protein At1g71210, mitochondrial [Mangifera indica]